MWAIKRRSRISKLHQSPESPLCLVHTTKDTERTHARAIIAGEVSAWWSCPGQALWPVGLRGTSAVLCKSPGRHLSCYQPSFQLFSLQAEFKLKTLLRPAHFLTAWATASTKPLRITLNCIVIALETESLNKEDLIIQDWKPEDPEVWLLISNSLLLKKMFLVMGPILFSTNII